MNLYSPLLQGTDSYTLENNYCEDIFLKSLVVVKEKTVTSNINKLTDQKVITDYKKMVSSGSLKSGLVLLNKYLNNGFLKYNPTGYIPSRQALLSNDENKK